MKQHLPKDTEKFQENDYLIVCIRACLSESTMVLKRHRPAVLPELAPLTGPLSSACLLLSSHRGHASCRGEFLMRETASKVCASWSSPDASLFS